MLEYSGTLELSVGLKSPVYVEVLPHISVASVCPNIVSSLPAQRWPGAAHCQFSSEANTLRRLMVSVSSLHIHQILVSSTPALSPATTST